MINRFRTWWLVVLWALATVPFLTRLTTGWTSYDVNLYWTRSLATLNGAIPYADVPFEYPPYALIGFLVPAAVSNSLADFRLAFGLLIWAIDAGLKGWLLWQVPRRQVRARDFVPFVMYLLATAALGHLLLQRYDAIPAALSLAALLALWRRWTGWAGALVAVAAGAKIYPALFIPLMAVHAWRHGRPALVRFAIGGLIGVVPLLLAIWWMPWWRFVTFHAHRGLQVESLWASIIWMLHFAGVPARWELVSAWYEVTGPVSAAVVGPALVVWVVATSASLVRAVLTARHLPLSVPLSSLALLMLMPLVSFVAFSPVLSPQFHLWLLPWCAVAVAVDDPPGFDARLARRAVWGIFFSTLIVPVFYPSPTYSSGLDPGRSAVLLLRNSLLVYASMCLWLSARRVPFTPMMTIRRCPN